MYVKVFDRLLRSSIMAEDVTTRWVWVALLTQANRDGIVYGTRSALARAVNVPACEFNAALDRLTAPDPDSSSDTEEGRRIVEVAPNTWRIVNYSAYREMRDNDAERQATRDRVRRHRERKAAEIAACNGHVTERNGLKRQGEAYTEGEADTEIPTPVVPAPSGSGSAPAPLLAPVEQPVERKATPKRRQKSDVPPAANHDLVMTALTYWREKWPHHRVTPGPGELAYDRTSLWVQKRGLDFVQAVIRGSLADDWPDRRRYATMDVLLRDDNRDRFAAMDPENPNAAPEPVAPEPLGLMDRIAADIRRNRGLPPWDPNHPDDPPADDDVPESAAARAP